MWRDLGKVLFICFSIAALAVFVPMAIVFGPLLGAVITVAFFACAYCLFVFLVLRNH